MYAIEETYNNITSDNIFIDEFEFGVLKGLVVSTEGEYHIGVSRKLSDIEKKYVVEHEYSHILTNTFYTLSSSKQTKARRETKANDNMIERLELDTKVLKALREGFEPYSIIDSLGITNEVYSLCIKYLKRKGRI